MKGFLKKFKNPKFLVLAVIFLSLVFFSPFNSQAANNPIRVTEVQSSALGGITQWVTDSVLQTMDPTDWVKTGGEKFVDPSTIQNGVLQPTGSNWIVSLAKAIAGYIINSILAVIYLVLWVVYSIAYGLTLLSEKILEVVLDPMFVSKDGYLGGFTTKEFVRNAAQLLANLCNMLYLFVLIYIGIKAMFGNANTRNLLTKLVIAALLTNFGLVLAGVVIDFSQVIMYSVWEGIKGAGNNFAPGTKILDELQNGFQAGRGISQISVIDEALKFLSMSVGDAITEVLRIAGLIVMSLALVVTLVSIAVILMIRIVALWVLLILTPVAFLCSILPQTEKHWNDWLETLTKYAFTGPILIFFLWLGLKLSASVTSADKLGQIVGSVPNSNGDFKYLFFGLVAKNMTTLFEMFTIIITVWAGILIANRFGIKGAASINGLMKGTGGLIHAIPWYSGRVASWGSLLFGKVASGWSQRRSAQAELARSTGDTAKADDLEKRAKWWTDKEIMVKKQKDRAIKAFSVMNPFIMKKQFAAWWNQNVKEHMEQSEASVDEFGRDLVRTITFGKGTEGGRAEITAEAKINNLNKTFADKYAELEKTKSGLTNAESAAIRNGLNLYTQDLSDVERKLDIKNRRVLNLRDYIRKAGTPGSPSVKTGYEQELKKLLPEIKALEVDKKDLEEKIKIRKEPIEQFTQKRDKANEELRDLGSSLAELVTTDDQEKANITNQTETLISTMSGPLPTGYSFSNNLSTVLGYGSSDVFTEKAKKLSRENTIDLMTEHIWQKDKKEKEVKEKLQELEDKRYTFEQLEDMAKSGYGDAIMRTAIFRRLASSPKNFGNLMAKTLKDYNNDEKKALEFLKQRYSEDELTKAFSAAEIEARKSNNLFSMGWLKHDSIVGKLRLSRPNERSINLANFAKGMTSDNINKIHPQSFRDPEAIKQMAQSFDWVKLARNPRFVDNMSQSTRTLFKEKQPEFEQHMSKNDKDAFQKIIRV